MLMAVKNQMRVCALAVKYNIMREMLNKVTFLTNILFMMFNLSLIHISEPTRP